MVNIPMPYDRNRAGFLPPSLQLLLSEPTQLLPKRVRNLPQDEFASLTLRSVRHFHQSVTAAKTVFVLFDTI